MKYYVYILQCADSTYYTGIAKDLKQRLARHNSGHGARYTRGRLPVMLVYHEVSSNIRIAMRREREIRRLSRSRKQQLLQ
ncbi:MAG: GIY-YIG nuclease family protein [candidate division WOR-3 bacterium]|nr:MAG: GIY-YIG nuclease family protein [candidate division WOR-3 bacterium]